MFSELAEAAGLPRKTMYTVPEVARAVRAPVSTVHAEARAGRLRTALPPGRRRGRLAAPEWVDEWMGVR